MSIRPAAVANQFYPGDKHLLKQNVLEYLAKAEASAVPGPLKAVIAPHAGYQYSGVVAGAAYKLIKGLDQTKQWKVLLLGVSHNVPFAGAAVSEDNKWETPFGLVEVKDVRSELVRDGSRFESENIVEMPQAHEEEHSLEVQLPFLQICLKDFILYPLALGSVRPDFLANDLEEFVKREDVLTVVSSDLSHFLEYEKACEVDQATSEAICSLDIEKMAEIGDACGRMGILTLMCLSEKPGWKCKMLEYMNSGDTAGDKSRVVGYGAYGFYSNINS